MPHLNPLFYMERRESGGWIAKKFAEIKIERGVYQGS